MERKVKLSHPGFILRKEIESRGLNVTEAADLLQITRPSLSAVLNGRGGISPVLALKVEYISVVPPAIGRAYTLLTNLVLQGKQLNFLKVTELTYRYRCK